MRPYWWCRLFVLVLLLLVVSDGGRQDILAVLFGFIMAIAGTMSDYEVYIIRRDVHDTVERLRNNT